MASVWRKGRLPLAVGLALATAAVAPATAQFFFRPYYQTWRYELPPDEEDMPRYASRRAVARIMAREGYELVGPLGRRGDQIVATGVSRRAGQARFFIDPYEGEVLHVSRLGPPPAAIDERRAPEERRFPEERASPRATMPKEPRMAPPAPQAQEKPQRGPTSAKAPPPADIDKAEAPKPAQAVMPAEAAQPQPPREPAKVEAARPPEKTPETPKTEFVKTAPAAAPPTVAKVEPDKPEAAKPEVAKAEVAKSEAGKSEASKPESAKPEPKVQAAAKTESKPAPVSAARPATPNALPQRPVAARSTGGGSHRAIVPPRPAEGVTAVPVTPAATPPSAAGGKTPTGVAMPKDAE